MPPASFADYVTYFLVDRRDRDALERWFASLPASVPEPDDEHDRELASARSELERLAILEVSHELTTVVMHSTGTYTSPGGDYGDECCLYIDQLCGGTVLCECPASVVTLIEPLERASLLAKMNGMLLNDPPEEERPELHAAMRMIEGASDSAILVAWDDQGA